MPAHFNISVDDPRAFVRIDLSGFFTIADVDAFAYTWRHTHARLRCPPNQHVTLCDLSRMNIQSQDVVTAFAAVVRDTTLQSRRLAMVVGVSLARHQAMRLATPERESVCYFYDVEAAEAWLFSDDRTASRYPHAPASPTSGGRDCTDRSAA